MTEIITIGDHSIAVTRKNIKHVHLSVYPPDGRVTLAAPTMTRLEVARAYLISKLGWIQSQQARIRGQAREAPRRFIERESHQVWGRYHLLTVKYCDAKPSVAISHKRITLTVRPGTTEQRRGEVIHDWHKSLLHEVVPFLIKKWEPRLGVKVRAYFLQRMKTKWGSCNHRAKHIRLSTELVKKPKDLLEYVVVHEMLHLIAPTHNAKFITLLNLHYPFWREARAVLNELPLSAGVWRH
jgi:predicted metal-dependent hydrolase